MAKQKYLLSKNTLYNLYHKRKLNTFQIAKMFNCTAGTIINRMREFSIRRRNSGPKRINISKKTLHFLYIKKRFSSEKIAKICHCNQTAILNRLRKYHIPVRYPKQKIAISRNNLKKLYIKRKLSAYKIAIIYHCSPGTIYRHLKLHRIKTRPLKYVRITKNQLKNLYVKRKFSLSKIAEIYNCCPPVILGKMQKYQIPRRTISETSTLYPKNNFNGILIEKAYMVGFRLGDLRVRRQRNLIGIGCGTTKEEQVDLIKTVFGPYGPVWVGKRDKRGAVHVECSLNSSFAFLLPKHELIPKWILRSKKILFSFFAGYTDAEGNIGIYGGRAKFRIRSYDKEILRQFHNSLQDLKVKSLFGLDQKAHIDKRGVAHNKDCWQVIINERESLLKLFHFLEPLMKHKKRKRDLLKAKENVILRLKI